MYTLIISVVASGRRLKFSFHHSCSLCPQHIRYPLFLSKTFFLFQSILLFSRFVTCLKRVISLFNFFASYIIISNATHLDRIETSKNSWIFLPSLALYVQSELYDFKRLTLHCTLIIENKCINCRKIPNLSWIKIVLCNKIQQCTQLNTLKLLLKPFVLTEVHIKSSKWLFPLQKDSKF